MSFDLFVYAGGYWGKDDAYLGGEAHEGGKHLGDGFTLKQVEILMVEFFGFDDNMRKVSWFPPETPNQAEHIVDDEMLMKAVHYGIGSGALTIYVVREDDPYIGRRLGAVTTTLDDEVDDLHVDNEIDYDGRGENDIADVNEDSSSGEEGYFSGSDGDSKVDLDEKKYHGFEVGQEYKTIGSFKSALHRYAVKKKRDIKYKKSDIKYKEKGHQLWSWRLEKEDLRSFMFVLLHCQKGGRQHVGESFI